MTILLPSVAVGRQQPARSSIPPRWSSAGDEAIELAASAGLFLDEWQKFVLHGALGERQDRQWAASEVALIVPRQNGKGAVLEARELAGLFLFGERVLFHTAHEFKTAAEAFRRVLELIENTRDLESRVSRVTRAHGSEGIELKNGARLRFIARSAGSGRGMSGDCVILDEAFNLRDQEMAALFPTMAARPNPQLWYTSSAPLNGEPTSAVLRGLCHRGRAGNAGRLAYFEWASDGAPSDLESWSEANPALGGRISQEFLADALSAMGSERFEQEFLGKWVDAEEVGIPIPFARWLALRTDAPRSGEPSFGVEVESGLSAASIGVSGVMDDGRPRVALADHAPGIEWVVARLLEHGATEVAMDVDGAAAALVRPIEDAGIRVVSMRTGDVIEACGELQAAVFSGRLAHPGNEPLDRAVQAARRRDIGDAGGWVLGRKNSTGPISALQACAWAKWLHDQGANYDVMESFI